MAKKKTNRMPTGEKAKQLSGLAYRTARDVGSAAEGAAIAGRNRDFAKKEAAKAAAKKASYSPAPMSAAAKKKAAAAGKKTESKTLLRTLKPIKSESRSKAGSSTVSKVGKALANTPAGKVVKRAKIVAREARDIPTSVSTAAKVAARTAQGKTTWGRQTGAKNIAKQIVETGRAVVTGKKGTEAPRTKKLRDKETYYYAPLKRK